jgi:hypothetical protein
MTPTFPSSSSVTGSSLGLPVQFCGGFLRTSSRGRVVIDCIWHNNNINSHLCNLKKTYEYLSEEQAGIQSNYDTARREREKDLFIRRTVMQTETFPPLQVSHY